MQNGWDEEMDKDGTKRGKRLYPLLLVLMAFLLPETSRAKEELFSYHFADEREGAEALFSNETYIRNLNQNDLDFRLQKKESTTEET